MAERIGEILLRKKVLTNEQLEKAVKEQTHTGEFLGEVLIRLKFAKEEDVLKVLAEQFNTRYVSLDDVRVNPQVLKMVPADLAWEYKFLPVEMRASVMLIAISNPLDMWPMSVVQERLDLVEVQIVLAAKKDILKHLKSYYGPELGTIHFSE